MSLTMEHRLIWQDRVIEFVHVHNWHKCGIDHLDITCVSPERAALPFTETGYKSHFLDESRIIEAGGAVAYVRAWLDHDAQSDAWRAHVEAARQGTLF